jgi:hypothetical protein
MLIRSHLDSQRAMDPVLAAVSAPVLVLVLVLATVWAPVLVPAVLLETQAAYP